MLPLRPLKKFPEIAIFTVSNAMGERIEPEFVEPIYDAFNHVIPITPLNSKELEKFKSAQNYLYDCQRTGQNTIECYRKPIDDTPPWTSKT